MATRVNIENGASAHQCIQKYLWFFKVKEDGHCISKCMYNILGINQNGRKEVLGFYLAESEVLVGSTK